MLTKGKVLGCLATLIAVAALTSPALAGDTDTAARMANLQQRIEQLEKQLAGRDMERMHRDEMKQMMKEILDDAQMQPALPSWLENLKFYGDVRMRFESRIRSYSDYNGRPGAAADWRDSHKNRNRVRGRLRFGFTKTWWDKQMEVGFRLASGGFGAGTSDSRNFTLGDQFGDKPIAIDLMYAKYKPKWAKGLEFTAGKMKNPIASATGMSWDGDINPEGLYLKYTAPFCGPIKPYAAFGYWFWEFDSAVNDNDDGDSPVDITYWTYELGLDWDIMENFAWGLYTTYYGNVRHWDAEDAGGNGRYADWEDRWGQPRADFGILEMTTQFKWKMDFMPSMFQKWKVWFSWVHNCKDTYQSEYPYVGQTVPADAAGASQFEEADNAYNVGIKVGDNKKKGDLSLSFEYRWIEKQALPSIDGSGWPDSDFANRFGATTNVKGWIMGAKYNIDDFLTIGGKLIVAEPISSSYPYASAGPQFQEYQDEDSSCTIQVDMVWKF